MAASDQVHPSGGPDGEAIDITDSPAGNRLVFLLDAAMGEQLGVFNNGITSAAFVDLLHILPSLDGSDKFDSYTVMAQEPDEENPRFAVSFNSSKARLTAWVTMSRVKQEWKISAIKVPGVRD